MASPQLDARTASPVPVPPSAAEPPARRRVAGAARAAWARGALSGAGPRSVAPVTVRRDPVRPGARPARFDGLVAGRPVRGGCAGEAWPAVRPRYAGVREHPAPLRLTARGRRVVAGLSMVIGLSIAAGTVVGIEVHRGSGLQLAGSDTVVVRSGDTLWSIARDVAPEEDRRAVVDAIVELNGLDSVDLLPGAELRLP
jgi:nucleoid-associated protein YgaU